MAPELLTGGDVSTKVDVYSFAIILWEMYTRRHPYEGCSVFQVALLEFPYFMFLSDHDRCTWISMFVSVIFLNLMWVEAADVRLRRWVFCIDETSLFGR